MHTPRWNKLETNPEPQKKQSQYHETIKTNEILNTWHRIHGLVVGVICAMRCGVRVCVLLWLLC